MREIVVSSILVVLASSVIYVYQLTLLQKFPVEDTYTRAPYLKKSSSLTLFRHRICNAFVSKQETLQNDNPLI